MTPGNQVCKDHAVEYHTLRFVREQCVAAAKFSAFSDEEFSSSKS